MVEDDPVVSMLDSLANLKVLYNTTFLNSGQSGSSIPEDAIPSFPDSVYRARITQMSIQSPFEYVYNTDVRKFIDLYAFRRRALTARILGLSQIYFPLFEEQLDRFNMPLELKYLAVIESALIPNANSRAGAKGLWQFMYGTGKVYSLKISSYVDDRYDPIKSTIAACEHLNDLYNIYGNWSLVLAAYNSGAGNVNKAIRRAGGAKNFWIIQRYLPRETRSYVPAFIAASYVLTYASEHKITPVDPGVLFYEIDTVMVKNPLSFGQISEMLHVPMDELQFLNPTFKQGVIPATSQNPYCLRLRKKYIGDFVNNENALYAYRTKKGMTRDSLIAAAVINSWETTDYKVKSGETLAGIAKKFHMTTQELKYLNGLKRNYVKPRQHLLVYCGTRKKVPERSTTLASLTADSNIKLKADSTIITADNPNFHMVLAGENLTKIAEDNKCTANDLIRWNNLDGMTIFVGQKLKVTAPVETTENSNNQPAKTVARPSRKNVDSDERYLYYTVQPGDNLWGIAEKFDGATVSQIKKLNNIQNAQRIQPGQKIRIMPVER